MFTSYQYELASNALWLAFGDEYLDLDHMQRNKVEYDFLTAECSATEYRDRIFVGNLSKYVKCLS